MLDDYRRARRLGQKQVQGDAQAGRYPYPLALDDLLDGGGYQGAVPMGTIEIDLALIAGTKSRGRQNVFSRSFMPLPEEGSEFAQKWMNLLDVQRTEGIRDPIVAYEYLQRFYVQEGNKRVSVMAYLGQPSIAASVIRLVPMPRDSASSRLYDEFMRFYAVAPVYGITFSREGSYARLATFCGRDLEERWPDEDVRDLNALARSFREAFEAHDGAGDDVTAGDALLVFLKVYGFDRARSRSAAEIASDLTRIWDEVKLACGSDGKIAYLERPTASASGARAAVSKVLPAGVKDLYHRVAPAAPFYAAFIYARTVEDSGWALMHETARRRLEERSGGAVRTSAVFDCAGDAAFHRAVRDAASAGADLVVTVSPTQMPQALRAAVAYPQLKFINCSVSLSQSAVRTFAIRTYEVKYLLGALAAALAPNHRLGYVAKAPVFGTVAEINAFALGALLIDPCATVSLKWFSAKGYDWRAELAQEGVSIVCGRDYANPGDPTEEHGLYRVEPDAATTRLGEPVFRWERYYELIIQSIRNNAWSKEASSWPDRALNYWWGLPSGVLDVRLTDSVPVRQCDLVEVLRRALLSGFLSPFAGELVSQEGVVQRRGTPRPATEAIARMSWLAANVIGRLPLEQELSPGGLEEAAVSGVIPVAPEVSARAEAKS